MLSKNYVESVKRASRENIVSIINEFVPLKREGSLMVACCPFHEEKSPSFKVSEARGSYKCFGQCSGEKHGSGDAIRFVESYLNLSYPEAIVNIGNLLNIPVEYEQREVSSEQLKAERHRKLIIEANGEAATQYVAALSQSNEAVQYLISRGFVRDDIINFNVGFAPVGGLRLTESTKYSKDVLLGAGLISENETGQAYDFFRARVIYPIHSEYGEIVGFAGRITDPSQRGPKYTNTRETEVFKKSQILYGLHQMKLSKSADNRVVNITEGYQDVIASHRHGFTNTVCTMGTSVGEAHIQRLKRLSQHVRFVMDGDKAGNKSMYAAAKVCAPYLSDQFKVTFVVLPDGQDPDEVLTRHGADVYRNLLAKEISFEQFLVNYITSSHNDDAHGQATSIAECKAVIDSINDTAMKVAVLNTLSKSMGLSQELKSLLGVPIEQSQTSLSAPLTPINRSLVDSLNTKSILIGAVISTNQEWLEILDLESAIDENYDSDSLMGLIKRAVNLDPNDPNDIQLAEMFNIVRKQHEHLSDSKIMLALHRALKSEPTQEAENHPSP